MDLTCILKQYILLLCIFVLAFVSVGVNGRSRGGSSRSSSSSRSRYSSSSTSRTSRTNYGSSYVQSSVRSPSRYRSTYISTIPTTRYSRGYSSSRIGVIYWMYYPSYGIHARSAYYMNRRRPGPDSEVCANYEANDENATLGVFSCPLLDKEPRTYTQCCGDKYAEFCCEADKQSSSGKVVGIVIGVFILVALVITGIVCCTKNRTYIRNKMNSGKVIRPPPSRSVQYQAPNTGPYAVSQPDAYPPAVGGQTNVYPPATPMAYPPQPGPTPYPPGPDGNKVPYPPPYPPAPAGDYPSTQPLQMGSPYPSGPPPAYTSV